MFSDDDITQSLQISLDRHDSLPDHIKKQAIGTSKAGDPEFILSLDNIREESKADVYATAILYESTISIMQKINSEEHEFDFLWFVYEIFISLNIIILLGRCERVCAIASSTNSNIEVMMESLFQPILTEIRSKFVRLYLESALYSFQFDDDERTREREYLVAEQIDVVMDALKDDIDAIEKGVGAAIRFALDRIKRPTFFDLLTNWDPESANAETVTNFLQLVKERGFSSQHIRALAEKYENPNADIQIDFNQSMYLCPIAISDDESTQPFYLPTKHGNLVFVFISESEPYKQFYEVSNDILPKGWHLGTSVYLSDSTANLETSIRRNLPIDVQFIVSIEGTKEFQLHMEQMSDGTLWP